jgi:hypothetical protein
MGWVTTPSGAQVWVDPGSGKAQLQDRAGKVYEQDIQHADASLQSGQFYAASPGEVKKHDDEGTSAAEYAATAAEGVLTGAYDAAISPAKALTAWGTWQWNQNLAPFVHAAQGEGFTPGEVEDPLARVSGRTLAEDIVAVGTHIAGGESEVAAREYEEEARRRAKENPLTHTVSRLAGEIAYTAPMGLLGAHPTSALGKLAAGVAEGGVLGTTMASEDAFIEDREQTAETTMAAMGLGSLIGGGVGLAFHAAGKYGLPAAKRAIQRYGPGGRVATKMDGPALGSRVSDEAMEEVIERTHGSVQPGEGGVLRQVRDYLQDKAEREMARRTGGDLETMQLAGPLRYGKEAKLARDIADNPEQYIAKSRDEAHEAFEDMLRASSDATEQMRAPPLKAAAVRKNLAGMTAEEATQARAAGKAVFDEMREGVAELTRLERAAIYGEEAIQKQARRTAGAKWAHQLNEWTAGLGDDIDDIPLEDLYIRLDRAKRTMQQRVKRLRVAARSSGDEIAAEVKLKQAAHLDKVEKRVRQNLMSETHWGQQGRAQARVNAAYEKFLGAAPDAESMFGRRLRTVDYETGFRDVVSERSKFDTYMRQVGTINGDERTAFLRRYTDGLDELGQTIRAEYEMGEEGLRAVTRIEQASAKMRRALQAADETTAVANRVNSMLKGGQDSSGVLGILAPTGLGGMLGGAPGAAIGAAATGSDLLSHPGRMLRILEPIVATRQMVGDKLGKGLTWLAGPTSAHARKLGGAITEEQAEGAAIVAARKAGQALKKQVAHGEGHLVKVAHHQAGAQGQALTGVGDAGAPTTTGLRRAATGLMRSGFQKPDETKEQAYTRNMDDLVRAQGEMTARPDYFQAAFGELAEVAPRLSAAIAQKAATGAGYLIQTAPAGTNRLDSLTPHLESPQVSDGEIQKWADRWSGVQAPLSILDDLKAGKLSRAKVEAVKAVYPRLYEAIRWGVMDQMSRARVKPPYQTRLQLDTLLELNGAAEPSVAPAFLGLTAQAEAKQKKAEAARRQPRRGGSAGTTKTLARQAGTLTDALVASTTAKQG